MKGRIPKDPKWCIDCLKITYPKLGGICPNHLGKNGKAKSYTGEDQYVPTEWVLEVVGQKYRHDDHTYTCIGYDPRTGFFMQDEEAPHHVKEISERAIDRTFHVVRK